MFSMCASLRTLLAYEDTAFDVPARREVDRAVSSGDVTSAMLDKIRRVRRDGFIGPSVSDGRDGLDPNITAEYLDHTLIENEIAPLENLCMTSDTVLAEVAACHEIISKRLGNEIHVDHLGRLRCYAVVGMTPPPEINTVVAPQTVCSPAPAVQSRSGDVAACLREGKAKNRRLIWLAAASVAVFVVGIVMSQRPATVRVEPLDVARSTPLPDAPSSLDSFVFDDNTPPPLPPIPLRATLVEPSLPVASSVSVETADPEETTTPHVTLIAAVPQDTSPWSIPTPQADSTSLNELPTTTPEPPATDETSPATQPTPRRVNPLRPNITALPLVPDETETPEFAIADVSPPPLAALPAGRETSSAQTVAWEIQEITNDFIDAQKLPAAIDALDTPREKTSEEAVTPPRPQSATRLALGNEGDTTIPQVVAFASGSSPETRRASLGVNAVQPTISPLVATIEPIGTSLAFLAATPDTPWNAVTTSDECPSGGYVLTVAPFQTSLAIRGGGNVRLIGDCKVSLTETFTQSITQSQAQRIVTLAIDYGRCVITLPPNATEPVTLRIQTEQGGGFVTLPVGKGIVFVDTFAQRGTTSPPPITFRDTDTLRKHCETVPLRGDVPRDIVLGFLPDNNSGNNNSGNSQDASGETVFLWQSDAMRDAVPVRQSIAVLLGHNAAAGYATSLPNWLTATSSLSSSPSGSRLIAAWHEASADGDDDLGNILGRLGTNRVPEVRGFALRLWGDLGHFNAPLTAFTSNSGDDDVRGVMSVYFREVLRRDRETITRLTDAISEL
ncbi:MAG: hypothetical protein ACRC46_08410 [Thermoguttaceae bacterium]